MSKPHRVRINQGRIIPLWLRFLLTVGIFSCMMYAMFFLPDEQAALIAIFLSIPVLPMWNAYYLFEIDINLKAFFNGYWAVGYKWGKWTPYQEVKGINIQVTGSNQSRSSRIGNKSYHANLVLSDGKEVFILGNSSKTRLEELTKEISKKIQVDLL